MTTTAIGIQSEHSTNPRHQDPLQHMTTKPINKYITIYYVDDI